MDEKDIAALRRFNRFFTKFAGVLNSNFLDSGMTLAEARILFEIANAEQDCFADGVQRSLDLDAGFVSRVLARFARRGWIRRVRLKTDARRRAIQLSARGRKQFDRLDRRQRQVVEEHLRRLNKAARERLVNALKTAEDVLAGQAQPDFSIRTFRAGDMGLIASRQAVLYREGYGWNAGIEVNIGQVVTAFLQNFKEGREQCWVAEVDGRIAGSIFLTDEGNGLSRLRLLYVEPDFQGRGIGEALVAACLAFARTVGYARTMLWTHSILEGARRIYQRHGFELTEEEDHTHFGPRLRGEIWVLNLAEAAKATRA